MVCEKKKNLLKILVFIGNSLQSISLTTRNIRPRGKFPEISLWAREINLRMTSVKGTVFFFSLEKFVATHSLNFGILCIFFSGNREKKIQVYFFFPEILYASLTQHIFRRLCEIWPKFVLKLLISVDYCFFLLLCTWNVWGVPKVSNKPFGGGGGLAG